MRVGVIQSNYLPWRGYFDFINSVDLFVIYDDVKYTKNDWRNRNQIKSPNGLLWLTVPVHYQKLSQRIDETAIDYAHQWQNIHLRKFSYNYGKSPFFNEARDILETVISTKDLTISQLNIRLIKLICSYLEIRTPIVLSQDYGVLGTKTERLINLLQKIEATIYLSGPAAQAYLDENCFREVGIGLEYKTYDYDSYPQLWGEFIGNVSVLDLIANTGEYARNFLSSKTPNQVVIKPHH